MFRVFGVSGGGQFGVRGLDRAPLIVLVVALVAGWGHGAASAASEPGEQSGSRLSRAPDRVLVVILDGFAYSIAAAAFEALGLPAPEPLVSAFPATTHVAMPALLAGMHADSPTTPEALRSPGYESRYFDWETRTATGGGALSYRRFEFPWRSRVDWLGPGVVGNAVGALRPLADSRRRIRRAIEAFGATDAAVFVAHIGSVDRLGHLHGPEAAAPLVGELVRALAALRSELQTAGRSVGLVVFSDHGMGGGAPLVNVLRPLEAALREGGYRPTRALRQAKDVALTPFGLVSSFEMYSEAPLRQGVAGTAVQLEGVDLCAWGDGADRLWVADATGEALIERRSSGLSETLRYTPISADPLALERRIAEQDQFAGRAGGSHQATDSINPTSDEKDTLRTHSGWRSPAEWFQLASETPYPDSVVRLSRVLDRVDNPASVVCSVAPGWMFGAKKTERSSAWTVGRLRYTHGALDRASSLGFVWSDCPGWQASAGARAEEGPLRALAACRGES